MELNAVLVQELIFAFVLFILTHYFVRSLLLGFTRRLPPGPKGWPVLGCLPLLGDMPHVSLARMVPKYGPVMFMKLGSCNVVIASKPSSARAFLKNLDQYFPNRPRIPAAIYVAYNAQDLVFLDHGARWKAYRKLSNLHMLGTKALGEWAPIRAAEIGLMIHGIYEMALGSKPVKLPEMLGCAMANMIGLVSINRRVFVSQGSESNEFKEMVVELMRLSGLFNIGDFIPSIAWMDLQGIQRRMKSIHKNFDALLVKMIGEHSSAAQKREGNPDFLDFVMESMGKSDDLELTFTHVKALLQGKRHMTHTVTRGLWHIHFGQLADIKDKGEREPNS
ncbi:Cytochrome P450 [Dillenia turbinata]|uniref:Cytochrome P450 n=1 Tax=Dillenia turbinata TaxID=194707 RepID=A0AAN8WDB8_9MAGN